jgi:predicted transcriptional regulator
MSLMYLSAPLAYVSGGKVKCCWLPCVKARGANVTAITIQLDDDMAEALRRLAVLEQRSETDIVRTALAAYAQSSRPLPKGLGKYHSGRTDISERARELIREDVKEGRWP